MSFEIISQRRLNAAEIAKLREATDCIRASQDRRRVLKAIGMSGAVLAASFCAIGPARAYIPVLVRIVQVTGRVLLRASVPAAITLYNSQAQAARGTIAVELKEPTGLVGAQDSGFADLPGLTETVLYHNRFRARMIGNNQYSAYSDLNNESDLFEVFDS